MRRLRRILLCVLLVLMCVCIISCGDNTDTYIVETLGVGRNANTEPQSIPAAANLGITIVIDPGHGGSDPGNIAGDYYEKDINLSISLKLRDMLQTIGIDCVLTRETDEFLYLSDRYEIANENAANLFVSVHCNAYEDDDSVNGLEAHYHPSSDVSKEFATYMQDAAIASTSAKSREIKGSRFVVLYHAEMPAVLMELGFMTNEKECANLVSDSYQTKIAEGLFDGIVAFLNDIEEV